MHSHEWRGKFAKIQERVLEKDGALGGCLEHVIHHMGFAPHRWESECTPRRCAQSCSSSTVDGCCPESNKVLKLQAVN